MDLTAYIMCVVFLFMCTYLFWLWFCFGSCVKRRQKTRSPQQRRVYVGTRARPSLGQPEPSIYVSPANYPPPPKYEAMAPPSYEEVVGIHYPQGVNHQIQPITQPIAAAVAQASNSSDRPEPPRPSVVLTVTNEQRTTTVPATA